MAKEEGYPDGGKLFSGKVPLSYVDVTYIQNSNIPTLNAWKVSSPLGSGGARRVVFERNPYYWKVDPNGSQLPYLDRVVLEVTKNADTMALQISHGEYTLPMQDVLTGSNKPVLARNRTKGEFRFVDMPTSHMNAMTVDLNFNHKDPQLRAATQNPDFRVGLSYAINRPEIIQAVYQRQGKPWQAAPRSKSNFYVEKLGTQYTAYDVAKANDHLDRAGYRDRDNQGFRVFADGNRISLSLLAENTEPTWVQTLQLIAKYWNAVGVHTRPEILGRSLVGPRISAGEYDGAAFTGSFGRQDSMQNPQDQFPCFGSFWAREWAEWYDSRHTSGERPPELPRRQMGLYDKLRTTHPNDEEGRIRLYRKILELSVGKEGFYEIGTVLPEGGYTVVQNDFRNVPDPLIFADLYYPTPGPTMPEQYFREKK